MTLSLVVGGLVTLAPHASAVVNTCRARNVTKDRPSRLNLQLVIDAADPGDTIAVRYVCVGNFTIAKDLRLVGRSTREVPRPVLDANGEGRVLTVSGNVRLANLVITGGSFQT
jgi:nitrous oxidase accessory protein NosD